MSAFSFNVLIFDSVESALGLSRRLRLRMAGFGSFILFNGLRLSIAGLGFGFGSVCSFGVGIVGIGIFVALVPILLSLPADFGLISSRFRFDCRLVPVSHPQAFDEGLPCKIGNGHEPLP